MAEAEIPVDLFNPGQVFACLGFVEAAETLLGEAEGAFDWSGPRTLFRLSATGEKDPVAHTLRFLYEAEVVALAPARMEGPWPDDAESAEAFPGARSSLTKSDGKELTASALPAMLVAGDDRLLLSHWLEGDGRATFKTFAGRQVGLQIAKNLLHGNPRVRESAGVKTLLETRREEMRSDPFAVVAPTKGSFSFDARGAWDALGAGTSLDTQKEATRVSPLVNLMAAVGLQNARPVETGTYTLRYMVWNLMLPPALARPALASSDCMLPRSPMPSRRPRPSASGRTTRRDSIRSSPETT